MGKYLKVQNLNNKNFRFRPSSVASGSITSSPSSSAGPKWTCPFCTFLNNADVQNCEMCNLPRSSRPH